MELIGGLKEKFDAAQSVMEKKSILADAGIQLSDDELTEVSGGASAIGFPNDGRAYKPAITIDQQKSF